MSNANMNSEGLLQAISQWNNHLDFEPNSHHHIFYLDTSFFGKVPMIVTLPDNYDKQFKYPLLVMLHGAVQLSSFDKVGATIQDTNDGFPANGDVFSSYFSKQNYVILTPIADPVKQFDWVKNGFLDCNGIPTTNRTFGVIVDAIIQLKQAVNIDDSRVYAIGHSDGADGCFGLAILLPSIFAGFVLYNSLLTNLHANDIYLNNAVNRPLYIVHSELDALRPINQVRAVVNALEKVSQSISFKEYPAMGHYDKHLKIDLPRANLFMRKAIRNPFRSEIYFESNNEYYSRCDWLKITRFDLLKDKAAWHSEVNAPVVDANGTFVEKAGYYSNTASYAIRGTYRDNTFFIESSRVLAFNIYLSPSMVDLSKRIRCIVNGVELFNRKVRPNKTFMIDSFTKNFDRKALWVNVIKSSLPD
jgi:dienelactone hydrolase